jgi:hypothetical protein
MLMATLIVEDGKRSIQEFQSPDIINAAALFGAAGNRVPRRCANLDSHAG